MENSCSRIGEKSVPACPIGTIACPSQPGYCYDESKDIMVSTYFMPEWDYCPATNEGNSNGGKPFKLNGGNVWYRHDGKKKEWCDWSMQTTPPATMTAVTAAPAPSTTAAPTLGASLTTATPSITTAAPTAPPEQVSFDNTVNVLVHADTYMKTGKLQVLTAAFGNLTKSAFKSGDLAQGWAVNSTGYLRNLSGKGLYLASETNCLAPLLETAAYESAKWKIKPTGEHWYEHVITSSCGNHLVADETDIVSLSKDLAGAKWFIIPAGKTQYQETNT